MLATKITDIALGILFVTALSVGLVAQSAGTDSVTATVTVQNVSVDVTDGAVAYGTLAASGSTTTLPSGTNDAQLAVNNGNVTETLNIKGSTSTPGSWTLASSVGTNQYKHEFSTSTAPNWVAMSVNYTTVTTTLASGRTSTLYFQATVPSSVTDYTQNSIDVTVQAVAN